MNKYLGRKVMKFGGSVFRDIDGYRKAADYQVENRRKGFNPIAVVSAPFGVTKQLKKAYDTHDIKTIKELFELYGDRYVSGYKKGNVRDEASKELKKNEKLLIDAIDKRTNRHKAVANGETHSGILYVAALKDNGHDAIFKDGYDAGIVVSKLGTINEELTRKHLYSNLKDMLHPNEEVFLVIGGYVGRRNDNGDYVLMGDNSTDVSALATASVLSAVESEIIKDVPGIYRIEPEFCETEILSKISYNEAKHLALRGAKVVHPLAIMLAKNNNIPIRVMSLDNTDNYTIIGNDSITTLDNPVAAISADTVYRFTIEDDIMNTPEGLGYQSNVLDIIKNHGINIIDSLAPGNTITIAVSIDNISVNKEGKEEALIHVINREMRDYGYNPEIKGWLSGAICLTGEAMKERPKTLSMLSGIPGDAGISVKTNMQVDEDMSEPAITFYVREDLLNYGVNAYVDRLFNNKKGRDKDEG